MNNFWKAAIGCAAAVLLMASCGKVVVNEQPAEGTKESSAIEYRSYDVEGQVVFHDYVPEQKKARTYHGYEVPYTIWTPTVIIECCGMRKRLCDQESYEAYRMDEIVSVTVTDGLDQDGNVVECDFCIKSRTMDGGDPHD